MTITPNTTNPPSSYEKDTRLCNEPTKFIYELCLSTFADSTHLKIHMKTHANENTFDCEICLARFNQKGNLKSHMSIHTEDETYRCEHCSLVFSTKSYLTRHQSSHGKKNIQVSRLLISFCFTCKT